MSGDECSSTAAPEPVADASGLTLAARRPGSTLRRLETLAQAELRQWLAVRQAQQDALIADPVWAGLVWDLGLNGGAIAAIGMPAPRRQLPLHDGD